MTREEAISIMNVIIHMLEPQYDTDRIEDAVDMAIKALEQKKGEWKMESDPYGFFEKIPVCSECGCTTEMRKTYNFCPNCGADMRGEEDDN